MAKVSMVQRELKRERLRNKYATKRAELKEIIRSPGSSDEERAAAQEQLQGATGAMSRDGRGVTTASSVSPGTCSARPPCAVRSPA
jgi:hypothetical protein